MEKFAKIYYFAHVVFKSKIDNRSYIVFMNNFVVDMKFIQIVFDEKKCLELVVHASGVFFLYEI